MSSESNGTKPDSDTPPSGPERRQSARAPSAWGAARDALAAVRNLEVLLRSASVTHRTILDLLPELHSSAGVLRDAFQGASAGESAASAVGSHGGARVDELSRLLDEAADPQAQRDRLATRAHALADELGASADLLALLERAAAPMPTEVSIGLIVHETARMSGSASGRELAVRLDDASQECVVKTDPYIVGSLIVLAVGSAHGGGADPVVVRARCSATEVTVVVEGAGPLDQQHPVVTMRVLPVVPATEQAARRVADRIGAALTVGGARWSVVLARAAG